jgi:hypothetical protein
VRSIQLALLLSASMLLAAGSESFAQNIRISPGGVEITPRRQDPPPPPMRAAPPRDELRDRMIEFRERCEEGDCRACVRLGIIIGENRERRAAWRRDNPELFFYER